MAQHTRTAQKHTTRQSIVDAAVECLTVSGYSAVRTRQIAKAAGVAQGTVTYHFDSRDALLIEAATQIIDRQLAFSLELLSNTRPGNLPLDRAVDRLWESVTTPEGLAVAHLWYATWSEPQLIPVVRALEQKIFDFAVEAIGPSFTTDRRSRAVVGFLQLALTVMRGLVQAIPVHGLAYVQNQWSAAKPLVILAARQGMELEPNQQ